MLLGPHSFAYLGVFHRNGTVNSVRGLGLSIASCSKFSSVPYDFLPTNKAPSPFINDRTDEDFSLFWFVQDRVLL